MLNEKKKKTWPPPWRRQPSRPPGRAGATGSPEHLDDAEERDVADLGRQRPQLSQRPLVTRGVAEIEVASTCSSRASERSKYVGLRASASAPASSNVPCEVARGRSHERPRREPNGKSDTSIGSMDAAASSSCPSCVSASAAAPSPRRRRSRRPLAVEHLLREHERPLGVPEVHGHPGRALQRQAQLAERVAERHELLAPRSASAALPSAARARLSGASACITP